MSIAVIITDRNTDALCRLLKEYLPDIQIQQWPEITDPEIVKLAVLWNHPPGITAQMPNLQMVTSMGAGMDHINNDPHISSDLIQARIVTLALQQNMAQYILQHTLYWHRHHAAYQQQQLKHQWQVLEPAEPDDVVVGFLGLGKLGSFVANKCSDLGFKTLAWTQSQKHPRHPCYHGQEGLKHVLKNSDFLVVLLPLNDNTKDVINKKALSWCKPSATLINVARGGHVNEADLLEALDSGQIKRAVLDVFKEEPLPAAHPFWDHPQITLTPHSSSRSDISQTAQQIIAYYRDLPDNK